MQTSKRADRVWLRLIQAYGTRVAESYGEDMPQPWAEAVDDLSDDQVAYGLRKVVRDSPIHPPALGQFIAACSDMPQESNRGPTIQEQLCAYASLFLRTRLHPNQYSLPWDYLYRQWIDETRPKFSQKCAECTGLTVPAWGEHPAFTFTVAEMLADKQGYVKAMRYFQPGPQPTRQQRDVHKQVGAVLA